MVGVGKGSHTQIPGLVPFQFLHVHKQSHQFRNGQSGMSVVQLYGSLEGETTVGGVSAMHSTAVHTINPEILAVI